jgi:hypothetical protein
MSEEYRKLVQQCAEQGQALARILAERGILVPLYLYYRASVPGRPGELFLVRDDAPKFDGHVLATGEGLRGNVPFESYFQWVYERARRCPILSLD